MSLFSNFNGKIVKEEDIGISPNNRSFKYGDGCFETMKIIDNNLLLSDLHFQRLFSSLETLRFTVPAFFTAKYVETQIRELVKINGYNTLARIRLVVYRGDGGLYDLENKNVNFIIQSWPGKSDSNYFNEAGFNVNIFTNARITADLFSSIKSNNYLRYAMAAMYAKENELNDCILTNAYNRIADSTIANVFIVTDGVIKTPALTEGCVSGVMRTHLLNCFKKEALPFIETEISQETLLNASEVFLTNANYGIRWVKSIGSNSYNNSIASLLHKKFIAPLFIASTF